MYSFFTQMGEKKKVLRVLASDYVEKSKFFLSFMCAVFG